MKLIILSGRSGAGKSVCSHILEDLGFFCIDNMPLSMLKLLAEQMLQTRNTQVVVSIDIRNQRSKLKTFKETITALQKENIQVEVIFLDANDDVLLRRFSETRRKHPLSTTNSLSLAEALQQESQLLAPIISCADLCIDTSNFNLHELRNLIRERLKRETDQLSLMLQSFGFKHGPPKDTDFLFDVRCLPNPYWIPDLRRFSGKDPAVIEYLEKHDVVQQMIEQLHQFFVQWLPQFQASNRSYLTISIGCTGGMHRSVYISETLAQRLRALDYTLLVRHRELV